jgi:hypothetical protein
VLRSGQVFLPVSPTPIPCSLLSAVGLPSEIETNNSPFILPTHCLLGLRPHQLLRFLPDYTDFSWAVGSLFCFLRP